MAKKMTSEEAHNMVGVGRHNTLHMARANTHTETIYILHSVECIEREVDLLNCNYTTALEQLIDEGTTKELWADNFDKAVPVTWNDDGLLVPLAGTIEESND